jgi:hypothetical protein
MSDSFVTVRDVDPYDLAEYAGQAMEATKKEQRDVDLELARLGAAMDRLKEKKKNLPVEVKKHEGRKKRAEVDVKAGEALVRNYYYSPDAIDDDEDDDESYEQEQQTAMQGGRTPSEYSSEKSERSVQNVKRWRKSRPDKRDLSDTVSYQDGRSSGNRSIPSASRRCIQSRIPQHTEAHNEARHNVFMQTMGQPRLDAGFEKEDLFGDEDLGDEFGRRMREGNLGGGAGDGSARISRSGGKQRQVVREVKTGPFTNDETPKLVEAIRMYYKEIDNDARNKWVLLANHMNRTSDSVRHHMTRGKGNHDYMKLVNARKKEVQDAADAQRAKYLADQLIQLQRHSSSTKPKSPRGSRG